MISFDCTTVSIVTSLSTFHNDFSLAFTSPSSLNLSSVPNSTQNQTRRLIRESVSCLPERDFNNLIPVGETKSISIASHVIDILQRSLLYSLKRFIYYLYYLVNFDRCFLAPLQFVAILLLSSMLLLLLNFVWQTTLRDY